MGIVAELDEAFDYADKITVYNDGEKVTFLPYDNSFKEIKVEWRAMLDGAYTMPAFGVSLNNETKEEIKRGLWVEFEFKEVMTYSEMPFEKLLIKVEKNYSGFNLVRYNTDRGYEGRCFYYNLVDKNMSDFYDFLLKL